VGAAVAVLTESGDTNSTKVIKQASTNSEGKFVAAGIAPGRYRVKAVADGFDSVVLPADVQSNKVTVFDSILLRRVGTLADQTNLDPDPKYAARRARGSIFQWGEEAARRAGAPPADDTVVAFTDRSPEIHGFLHAFSQSVFSTGNEDTGFVGANFALTEQVARNVELTVAGQMGVGEGATQRVETLTTASIGDRHRVSVALGYGRFTFSRRGGISKLGQVSLSATDTWQIAGPVLIVYGVELARFTEGASGMSVLPRVGVAFEPTARTRLFAGLEPGSSSDQQSKVSLESGEIFFSEPRPIAAGPTREAIPERSYRIQLGGEQVLSDRSSVEMMAFFDTVSGHGVGLLAIPADGTEPLAYTEEQHGRARGLRVVYRRRINRVVEGSVGYAFGEGQRFDSGGLSDPASLFTNGLFHVFSAKVDANFSSTGTKVSTVLRFAPTQAVFAIDPFQGQITTFDPNVSVSLIQDIPSFGFLPGQWQAVVDLRNLFDQQGVLTDERQELVASRFHRLIRVGLSLRF
jgi:hypothetical protein